MRVDDEVSTRRMRMLTLYMYVTGRVVSTFTAPSEGDMHGTCAWLHHLTRVRVSVLMQRSRLRACLE
jgi:hypothetical protein